MDSISEQIDAIARMSKLELILYLFDKRVLKTCRLCRGCNVPMVLKPSKDTRDGYNWRCLKYSCNKYQTTISIRVGNFFENFKIELAKLCKFLLYYSSNITQKKIAEYSGIKIRTVYELRKNLLARIRLHFIRFPVILGGPGVIVNIDETMLNFKAKSHRGRSPREQHYALAIVARHLHQARVIVLLFQTGLKRF
jgi:hypothetical protein